MPNTYACSSIILYLLYTAIKNHVFEEHLVTRKIFIMRNQKGKKLKRVIIFF